MSLLGNPKFEEFKASGRLPSPKGVALQVIRLTQQDDVNTQQIAHVIKADPALSGRLIKAANALLAHNTRPVVAVSDAVSVLGVNMVRQLALGFSLVADSRDGHCKRFDYSGFWAQSLLTAIAAQHLVRHKGIGSGEEIFVLGLLGQVGRLAMATLYPGEYAELLEKSVDIELADLAAREQSKFGFDHNQMTQAMLADWGMPRSFQEVALLHEHPEVARFAEGSRDWKLLNVMYIASSLAAVCMAPIQMRRKLVPRLMLMAARWGVETEMLVELGDNVIRSWAEWGRMLEIRGIEFPPFSEMLRATQLLPGTMDVPAMTSGTAQFFKLRILLVDDDRTILLLLKTMLANAGHEVETARNGVEALLMVEKFHPQLIISDWMMPEMDGIAFCKKLRENPEWRSIYVFIVTAQESIDKLVEAFEAGVDDYLTKPINSKVLGARLRAGQRVVQLQEELAFDRQHLREFAEELATSNHRLQQLALTDALTGLPNRRYAMDRLDQEWALSKRVQRPLACMMVDIDRFKSINDTFGHKVGDDALKHAVNALRSSSRKQDVICRLGGEEFLVICPDTTLEQSWQQAERLRHRVEMLKLEVDGKPIQMTVSIGVSSNEDAESVNSDMLIQQADRRLYAAKSAGRNRTVSA